MKAFSSACVSLGDTGSSQTGDAENNVKELLNKVVAVLEDILVADREAASSSERCEPLDGSLGARDGGTPGLNVKTSSRSGRRADDEVALELSKGHLR